ncbi:MAG: prolyl oligopeptidase family serine peptidase [Ignavibacteria bacterium]|nr:prolyl oligopeptidase family serine peptidase [Ignavibacteria bacterium]
MRLAAPSAFSLMLLLLPVSLLPAQQRGTPSNPTRGWLTVETIMRDPRWMGTSPSRLFWSEDGENIYFNWRQKGDEGDSLYVVSAKGGTPRHVTIEEQRRLPGRFGSYNKDRSKRLYAKGSDIFFLDIRAKKEIQLTSTTTPESNPRFTFDEQKIVFERQGNLFLRDLKTSAEIQLTNLQGAGGFSQGGGGFSQGTGGLSRDGAKSELQRYLEKEQLQLFEVLRERKAEREAQRKFQETLDLKRPKLYSIGQKNASAFVLSPDERYITFTLTQLSTDAKRTIVPSYVTESGFTEDLPGRTKVGEPLPVSEFYVYDTVLDSVAQIKLDDIPGIMTAKAASDTGRPRFRQRAPDDNSGGMVPRGGGDSSRSRLRPRGVSFSATNWSDDGKHAFVQLSSQDNKDRWIVMLDVGKAKFTTTVEHQRDSAWLSGPGIRGFGFGTTVGWLPDSRRIYFQSEEDGWSHLYTVTLDGKIKVQLTKGKFEIHGSRISKDKKRWYFSSNEVHFGERHLYSMPLEGGERTRITSMEGGNETTISPAEDRIALLYSFSNKMPELYVMENKPGAKAVLFTSSSSDEFRSYDWRTPDIFTFKARDGANVPTRLYKPERPNGAAVIFVHGAGYLQNAHKWWSDYYHEYMFHNLLTDKGYTVLDMDYRASAGLGRDWRTAIYRHMGGQDLDDNVDGARWLVQNYGVDPKRIGLYGGSYGGFITLMAMFTTPDVFAAGAALRPVTDWAHYNQSYTSDILNIPQEDTLAYRRSSPIFFADGLKGALLICHGMVDENVHFQDAVRLSQRLIELKKENWELAVFPVEDHGFKEPTSWMDEYKRILKLFETNLGKK